MWINIFIFGTFYHLVLSLHNKNDFYLTFIKQQDLRFIDFVVDSNRPDLKRLLKEVSKEYQSRVLDASSFGQRSASQMTTVLRIVEAFNDISQLNEQIKHYQEDVWLISVTRNESHELCSQLNASSIDTNVYLYTEDDTDVFGITIFECWHLQVKLNIFFIIHLFIDNHRKLHTHSCNIMGNGRKENFKCRG